MEKDKRYSSLGLKVKFPLQGIADKRALEELYLNRKGFINKLNPLPTPTPHPQKNSSYGEELECCEKSSPFCRSITTVCSIFSSKVSNQIMIAKRRTFSCEEISIHGKQAAGEYYAWRAAPWHKLTKVPPNGANNFSLLPTSKAEASGKKGIFMKEAPAC